MAVPTINTSFHDFTFDRKDDNYQKDDVGTLNFDTTGSVYLLNGIATGTDWETRIGRRIDMTAFTFRGTANGNSAAAYPRCRMLILYDKQTKQGTPSITTDILDGTTPAATFNRYRGLQRFEVLFDKYFTTLGVGFGGTAPATELAQIPIEISFKLNHPETFSGTGATVASIDYGALWLVTYGNQAPGTGAASLRGEYIVTYVDK